MANEYPFRSAIGPGTTTVTGDPNNPFGGNITQQSMIPETETPLDTIMRLTREGLSVDQIAQMTGFPQDEIAMQVAVMSGDRGAFMPEEQPQGIGIESLYKDTDTQELSDYVDQGNSITDLVSQELLNIEAPDPSAYLDDSMRVQTLENMGVDLDDEDADTLDEEDDPLKKLISASAVGAAANGEDDPDAVKTLNTMTEMNMEFDSNDPDDIKAQLEVYKRAA